MGSIEELPHFYDRFKQPPIVRYRLNHLRKGFNIGGQVRFEDRQRTWWSDKPGTLKGTANLAAPSIVIQNERRLVNQQGISALGRCRLHRGLFQPGCAKSSKNINRHASYRRGFRDIPATNWAGLPTCSKRTPTWNITERSRRLYL